ncbi:hypothetical protein [Microcoleus sp. FACHB-831]|nr:hypothetical protein [Microcoleus sp. FACHB-831]
MTNNPLPALPIRRAGNGFNMSDRVLHSNTYMKIAARFKAI